jgi:hypothetical protein
MQNMLKDPVSGLQLPRQFVDEKVALKECIDEVIDKTVMGFQHIKDTYYLTIHAKFDKFDPTFFVVSQPVLTYRLPPFCTNQLVFWVCNKRGICELLWMVTRGSDKKLKVEFNTKGVAYLQAKGAMPS